MVRIRSFGGIELQKKSNSNEEMDAEILEFAYLLLKEHPYGREMLRQILSEGFIRVS